MALALIAYPELSCEDYKAIEDCREHYDQHFLLVRPHFTLVFPASGFIEQEFIHELKVLIKGTVAIHFCIRCATVNKDEFKPVYHTFLVPDEGYSQLIKLHDKLYGSNLLNRFARLDIDYIPHITVANDPDPLKIKSIADNWNKLDLKIEGKITALTLVRIERLEIIPVENITLSNAG